ncbi:hypothetical protein JTB14_008184 [Gonioctena quinquepunctata]|nr:hypothetical protein JTB14_008184 [Gonioctena quinquepunctata]
MFPYANEQIKIEEEIVKVEPIEIVPLSKYEVNVESYLEENQYESIKLEKLPTNTEEDPEESKPSLNFIRSNLKYDTEDSELVADEWKQVNMIANEVTIKNEYETDTIYKDEKEKIDDYMLSERKECDREIILSNSTDSGTWLQHIAASEEDGTYLKMENDTRKEPSIIDSDNPETIRSKKKPHHCCTLTEDLVNELLGDGCLSDLEFSDEEVEPEINVFGLLEEEVQQGNLPISDDDRLGEMQFHGTGTIMLNRVHNHEKLDLKKDSSVKGGDIVQLTSEDVALVKWKENRIVLMASNCIGGDQTSTIARWDKKSRHSSRLLLRR